MPQLGPINWMFCYSFFWLLLIITAVFFWWNKRSSYKIRGTKKENLELKWKW